MNVVVEHCWWQAVDADWHVVVGRNMDCRVKYRRKTLGYFRCVGAAKSVEAAEAGSALQHENIDVMVFRSAPAPAFDSTSAPEKPEIIDVNHRARVNVVREGAHIPHKTLKALSDAVKVAEAGSGPDDARTLYVKESLTSISQGLWHVVLCDVGSKENNDFGAATSGKEILGSVQSGMRRYLAFCHSDESVEGYLTEDRVNVLTKSLYCVGFILVIAAQAVETEWYRTVMIFAAVLFIVAVLLRVMMKFNNR